MQELRKNEEYRDNEREKDKQNKIVQRKNHKNKVLELQQDKSRKKKILADPFSAQIFRERNKNIQASRLADNEKGFKIRENNRKAQALRLADETKGDIIRKNNRKAKVKILAQPMKFQAIREYDVNRKNVKQTDRKIAIENYELAIKEGPNMICVCCGGLFFSRSVKKFNENDYKNKDFLSQIFYVKIKCGELNCYWICTTCDKYSRGNQILPRLALSNGLNFNEIDPSLQILNELEERLCSPRIPFLRIRPLGWDKQKGITSKIY